MSRAKSLILPFLVALQFLTRVPIRITYPLESKVVGQSLLYYPLVGLIIGGVLLVSLEVLLNLIGNMLTAALLLGIWVLITGALHLDGLADSVDAWVGGMGDRSRSLEIMKDSTSGPMGVVSIVLLLIIKFAALDALILQQPLNLLVIIPIIGRSAAMLLIVSTPYARQQGMGKDLAFSHSPVTVWSVLSLMLVVGFFLYWQLTLLLTAATILVVFIVRKASLSRIGGFSGDVAGAVIELTECVCLCALVGWMYKGIV